MIDYDRLFKELITTFFGEFVDLFLPDVAAYLERDSLVFLDKEIFTDVMSREKHEADIVVQARFKGEEAFFLIHVENQSSPQADFGRRMLRYWARLYEKHGIPVYPVVIFSHQSPRTRQADSFSVAFPGFIPLRFQYRVIQLNRLRWRRFVDQPNPVASALMAKMNIAERDRPKVKFECLRLMTTLKLDPARMQLISGFVDTYLRLTAAEERRFRVQVGMGSLEEQEEVMEIVTSWMEEGLQQGIKQGIQRGQQQGRQTGMEILLLRQMQRRFGTLTPDIEVRIRQLNEIQLSDLGEALFDFSTLADLNNWLVQANI